MLHRGRHLVAADRALATGGGVFARLFAGRFHAILGRIDAGVAHGRLDLTLPDGVFRVLGGRGQGPVAAVHISSWRALARLAASGSVGWYKAWAHGEWASPDPVDRFDLKPGRHLLEIGCGWGGLAEIAARDYGVRVTALTLSAEQKAYADGRLAHAGLSGQVEVALTDYRDVKGRFDAVASVEMVEAVGQEYWPAYLRTIARVLKPGGKAAIQLISIREALFDHYAANTDFIQAYIFPGGLLISEPRFAAIAAKAGLSWHDRVGYGADYAETLHRWRARYEEAVSEGRLPHGFDEAFHDLWRYYLMYCEGGFRSGGIDVAQVTLVRS